MNKYQSFKFFSFLLLMLLTCKSYAIDIEVQSNAKQIMGLGFAVNGEQYGGMGTSYQKTDMPEGLYSFGVRDGSDVPCFNKGQRWTKLNRSTKAVLDYDGKRCNAVLYTLSS